jgi:hypothetical protein
VANYAEFISAILDTIDTKCSLVTVLTGAEPKLPKAPTAPEAPPTPPTASIFDIALSADKKTLSVRNTDIGLTIFIKLTSGDEILFSDNDEEGTYKKFFFATNATYPNDVLQDVMKNVGLLGPTGTKTVEFQYLFGVVSTTKYDYFNHLKDVIKLEKTQPVKKNFNHKYPPHDPISVGWV